MAYIMLILYIFSCAISAFVGFRLGRNGSASRASRYDNSSPSNTAAGIERSVEAAISSNAEASEVIQKMRDIVQRNCNNTDISNASKGD